jgi:Domain of unknown function (DUF3601)
MRGSSIAIQDLRIHSQYRVLQDFVDFYQNQFKQGELLTFVESHFLPYHGGHTVVFQERTLYLQEEVNSGILASLGDYLRLAVE